MAPSRAGRWAPGRDPVGDPSLRSLDDEFDRDLLRQRYYGLLQELRIVLPGVQILVAFLFTVPFNQRFDRLDDAGRQLYAVALASGIASVIALVTPTAFHRLGPRRSRTARLVWGIRATRVGLFFLAVSLASAAAMVTRFVFGDSTGWAVGAVTAFTLIGAWAVLPVLAGRRRHLVVPPPPPPQ
jgi:hypothetical protein